MIIVSKEKLEEMLSQNTRREVAEILGCTYRTLHNKIKTLGVEIVKKRKEKFVPDKERKGYVRKREEGYTEKLYKAITEERYAGATVESLARKYNKTTGTIYNIIHITKKNHERFT